MRRLLARAEQIGLLGEVPVCAVILDHHGRCIGHGSNRRERRKDPLGHAELVALRQAAWVKSDWRFNECTLIVTLEPCPMCAGALVNSRLSMVVFGMYDEKEGCCGSLYQLCRDPRFKHQLSVKGGIMEDACELMIKEFFNIQRNKTD